MEKISKIVFAVYFIVLFFYGLFIKFLYTSSLLSLLKFLPEFILLIFIAINIIRKKKFFFSIKDGVILFIFLLIFGVSFFNSFEFSNMLISIRDIYVPLISLFVLKSLCFDDEEKSDFIKIISIISMVFLVGSLYFGYMQYTNSYEYTAQFYTGRIFFGEDTISSINLRVSGDHIRALGLVGDAAKYGFYSVISFCIISIFSKKKPIFFISFILAFLNIWFSTNKTAIVLLVLCAAIIFIHNCSISLKAIKKGIFVAISFGLVAGIYIFLNLDKFSSIQERIELWTEYDYIGFNNLVVGFDIFNYFGDSSGWMAIMDNTFLFGASCFGCLFFIIFCYYLFENSKKSFITIILLVIFAVGGLTTNLFSGRVFFNILLLFIGIYCPNNKYIEEADDVMEVEDQDENIID